MIATGMQCGQGKEMYTSLNLQRVKNVTRKATWTGETNAYDYEGYPWLAARQGHEGSHKRLGPYGNLQV